MPECGAALLPISAIVLTMNEEANIGRCLQNLARVDDVIVVDSGSTDNTRTLAREVRPNVRIFEHRFKDFGDQRNWALDNTSPRNSWILFIDADEYCTTELLEEIEVFITSPGKFCGGFIAGKNYFLGRWLKRATMYPSYQLRLLRMGEIYYRKEGHGQKEVTNGPLHYFKESWRHEAFSKGVSEWLARHNRYSTDEVELILRLRSEPFKPVQSLSRDPISRRRALKRLGARLPFRPIVRFLYVYILRRGFLDGYPGFLYCLLRIAHDIHIMAKLAEDAYRRKLDTP
jgi:glycosyltransferase involved in cell wall biosynthesis